MRRTRSGPSLGTDGRAHPATVLAGKTVLVTGASSGIGRAVALRAADAGARVVLVARSTDALRSVETELRNRGGLARSYPADLSSRTSTAELLSRLEAHGVIVDVLVNNAGRSIRRALDESYDRAHDFERTMALNYFGSLRLICRASLRRAPVFLRGRTG